MCTVIAVLQRKGGVGKTTIAGNLSAALATRRARVHVFDLDPQQSLTTWAKRGRPSDFLPPHTQPIETDRLTPHAFDRLIDEARQTVDFLVLDCPPGFSRAALLAARSADLALLPVTPSLLDLDAVNDAITLVHEARRARADHSPAMALVPSRVIHRTVTGREFPDTLSAFGEPVLPAITQRIAIADATVVGQTIQEFAAHSAGALEFRALGAAIRHLLAHQEAHPYGEK